MRERFTEDMKAAMKAGDKRRLATVRLVQAALKDKDIEARGAGKGQATAAGLLEKAPREKAGTGSTLGEAKRQENENDDETQK